MTTTEETWLDLMPGNITPDNAVPMVRVSDEMRGVCLGVNRAGRVKIAIVQETIGIVSPMRARADWRIALDNSQGFGYALRWLSMQPATSIGGPFWMLLRQRHMDGKTTDADRIALARALREVTP